MLITISVIKSLYFQISEKCISDLFSLLLCSILDIRKKRKVFSHLVSPLSFLCSLHSECHAEETIRIACCLALDLQLCELLLGQHSCPPFNLPRQMSSLSSSPRGLLYPRVSQTLLLSLYPTQQGHGQQAFPVWRSKSSRPSHCVPFPHLENLERCKAVIPCIQLNLHFSQRPPFLQDTPISAGRPLGSSGGRVSLVSNNHYLLCQGTASLWQVNIAPEHAQQETLNSPLRSRYHEAGQRRKGEQPSWDLRDICGELGKMGASGFSFSMTQEFRLSLSMCEVVSACLSVSTAGILGFAFQF